MALAWKFEEGESETGGRRPLEGEWKEEGSGLIEGFLVKVLICRRTLKVAASKNGDTFEAQFGSDELVSAGMDARLGLDDYVYTLCSALLAERLEVSSRVLADGSRVVWIVAEKLRRRTFEYRLELPFAASDPSHSLRLELAESKEELAAAKQQLADSKTEIESLRAALASSRSSLAESKAHLREATVDGDAATQQLAEARRNLEGATRRVAELSKESASLKSQMAARPKAESRAAKQRLADASTELVAITEEMKRLVADGSEAAPKRKGKKKRGLGWPFASKKSATDCGLQLEEAITEMRATVREVAAGRRTAERRLAEGSGQLQAATLRVDVLSEEMAALKTASATAAAQSQALVAEMSKQMAEESAKAAAGIRLVERRLAEAKTESDRRGAELKAAVAECRTLETQATADELQIEKSRAKAKAVSESPRKGLRTAETATASRSAQPPVCGPPLDLGYFQSLVAKGTVLSAFESLHFCRRVVEFQPTEGWLQIGEVLATNQLTICEELCDFVAPGVDHCADDSKEDCDALTALRCRMRAVVEASKTRTELGVAAANCMTALNAAGVSFGNEDLSGVRIPNAILDAGVFRGADFRGADLSGVSFRGAVLEYCNFQGANLSGLKLGKFPELKGHRFAVKGVCNFGKNILTVSWDKTVRVWNEDYECHKVIEAHSDAIQCVDAFSDELFATGSLKTVKVWNGYFECQCTLEGHSGTIYCVRFSDDCRFLASASTDRTCRIWLISDGNCAHVLKHPKPVRCVVFANGTLFSGCDDKRIRAWNVESGKCLKTATTVHKHFVSDLFVFADCSRLVSVSSDKSFAIWSLPSLKCETHIQSAHSREINCVFVSENNAHVFTGANDASIRMWRVSDGCLLHVFGLPSLSLAAADCRFAKGLSTANRNVVAQSNGIVDSEEKSSE